MYFLKEWGFPELSRLRSPQVLLHSLVPDTCKPLSAEVCGEGVLVSETVFQISPLWRFPAPLLLSFFAHDLRENCVVFSSLSQCSGASVELAFLQFREERACQHRDVSRY